MFDDPIVRETRQHREAYAAALGYDLERIIRDLQARQGRDGRTVVDRTTEETSVQSETRTPDSTGIQRDNT